MKKLLVLAALALVGFSQVAHATTIDVLLGAQSTDMTYSTGGSLNPNQNLSSLSAGTLDLNNSYVISGSSSMSGYYAAPTGSLYGNSYLATYGSPTPGTATLHLAANENTFGFTWGSVDPYNYLILTDSRGKVFVVTGAQILSQLAGTSGVSQADFIATDPFGSIVSAQFLSTSNSFEIANFSESQSAVPLPSSITFFMLALAGLFFIYRKQQAV
jgi:hypothetical protein